MTSILDNSSPRRLSKNAHLLCYSHLFWHTDSLTNALLFPMMPNRTSALY